MSKLREVKSTRYLSSEETKKAIEKYFLEEYGTSLKILSFERDLQSDSMKLICKDFEVGS